MGNALAASLRLLNANLGALSKDRSAQVLASLQTIEHVKNVLIGDDKHFNPRVAEDLIEAASANLTQSISSNAVSEGLGPASTSILDQDTPMAEQSENLAPGNRAGLPELATQSKSLSVGDSTIHNATAPNAISLPTAPQPIHSNNAIITHPVGVIGTFPDLGDWQSVAEPVPHPLSGTPVLPRLPPISRATRIHGSGRQSLHGDTPLETLSQPQEKVKRQDTTEFDPLGVLFQA